MSFCVGDVVKYKGSNCTWPQNQEHIILSCEYLGNGYIEYSTNHGAWFKTEDFELVRKADTFSFVILDKSIT